jgi:hypothetical protein
MYGKSAFICDHIKAFSILVSVATAPYLYCSWEQKATEKRSMLAMHARLKCQNSAVATRLFAFSNLDKSGSVRKAECICHNSCCISVI